ncbi:glycosyltransferase family 2 protein [Vibrio sinaloensis]|uniref:glycosyltransferase family 2 protein n=1 Tax=Photobacterium sp. (strain ATCC 43367) TaxID=379097 RepID=UPI0005800E6D|nr:glycosyltransferase family A protein [Vibrio sinaloensis]KHT52228.1 hypothetical protein RJ46_01240 [Vibrio sinaloensis]
MFLVSVIIPMYNSETTIVRALDSVKSQSQLELIGEIIVVNDGSTDNSDRIVNEYAERHPNLNIKLLNKSNGGVASARNLGISSSSFDWIALLDSDDEWLSNKLEHQYNILIENKQIDLLGGEINDKPLSILGKKLNYLHKIKTTNLLIKMYPQTSTTIFKKSVFESIGGFDETLRYAEDGRFFVEVAFNFNSYYDPMKVVIYDRGKKGFGERGLTSNLSEMHRSEMLNLERFKQIGIIGLFNTQLMKLFYKIKYLRRIIISRGSK